MYPWLKASRQNGS